MNLLSCTAKLSCSCTVISSFKIGTPIPTWPHFPPGPLHSFILPSWPLKVFGFSAATLRYLSLYLSASCLEFTKMLEEEEQQQNCSIILKAAESHVFEACI